MRVIAWINKNSGVSLHRLIHPLLYMEGDVFLTNNLLEEHFERGCDIFIYNRVIPEHAEPTIKQLQKKYGFKIVVDIDDHWELDEHHVLYQEYQANEFAKRQVEHLRKADAVFATHSRLADAAKEFNPKVHILPNAIPKAGQYKLKKEPHPLVRLFWQGSDTHLRDIKLLKEPLESLGYLSPKMKMVMAGYVDKSDIWYEMAMHYTAETKHQYKLIPPADVDSYYAAYKHADICLVPLLKSRFNAMKSNLKILEAANLGLPVIASEVHPYLGLPVRYAKNSSDWKKHIHQLVNHKKQRRDEGLKLKEYCDKYFNFETINAERKQILEHIASKESV